MASSKSTKNAAQRASKKPSAADVIRIGLSAATTKANLPHKQWAQIVNAAHGKGLTVDSALDPSVPEALKARTKTSLRSQANQQVGQAYAPQEAELNYQTQQANGLQLKRTQDEASFNSWYAQKQAESNQRIQDAQTRYETAVKGASDAQAASAAANKTDLAGQVQQGASGDMTNSVYLKDAQAREQARADAAGRASTAAVATGADAALQQNANTASVQGRHDAALGNIWAAYGSSMQDITSNKMKLASSKAADTIKSYTDLLDQEASKANSQQQYQGLMAQLSDKQSARELQNQQFNAGLQAKDTQSRRTANTTRRGQDVAANTQIRVAGINSDSRALDRQLKREQGKLDRATQLRVAKLNHAKNPDGSPSDSAIKYSQAQVQVIHTVAQIIQKFGSEFTDKNGHKTNTRNALISRGYSGSAIDGGLSLARHGHITDQLAKQLGILPQHRG